MADAMITAVVDIATVTTIAGIRGATTTSRAIVTVTIVIAIGVAEEGMVEATIGRHAAHQGMLLVATVVIRGQQVVKLHRLVATMTVVATTIKLVKSESGLRLTLRASTSNYQLGHSLYVVNCRQRRILRLLPRLRAIRMTSGDGCGSTSARCFNFGRRLSKSACTTTS